MSYWGRGDRRFGSRRHDRENPPVEDSDDKVPDEEPRKTGSTSDRRKSGVAIDLELDDVLRRHLPEAIDYRARQAVQSAVTEIRSDFKRQVEALLAGRLRRAIEQVTESQASRIVAATDEQVERTRSAVQGHVESSVNEAMAQIGSRLEREIGDHIAEVDKRARKRAREQLSQEAQRLVADRLGDTEQRVLEVQESVSNALARKASEFSEDFHRRVSEELNPRIERLCGEAEERLRRLSRELQEEVAAGLREEIAQAHADAESKLASQAGRLAHEAARLHADAEERVRNQAAKRLRRHLAEIDAAAAKIGARSPDAAGLKSLREGARPEQDEL